jgi:hypothetical protein
MRHVAAGSFDAQGALGRSGAAHPEQGIGPFISRGLESDLELT